MNYDIGFHTNVKSLLGASDEFFKDHKVFQVMVGSPRTLQIPSVTDITLLMRRHPEITVVYHGPYCVNLCKHQTDRAYMATLGFYIQMAKLLDPLGVKYIVTHIGGRGDMDPKDSMVSIWNFCQKWLMSTQGLNIKLCLENDSGSKNGSKMGHMAVLGKVVKACNDPRIRMTFDSEHAYAAGFDTTDVQLLKEFGQYIDVVHLNSVPKEVVFGGHLDRHSTTSFYDSTVSPIPVLDALYDGVRPFIMEVESPVYVKSNLEWLKENWKYE